MRGNVVRLQLLLVEEHQVAVLAGELRHHLNMCRLPLIVQLGKPYNRAVVTKQTLPELVVLLMRFHVLLHCGGVGDVNDDGTYLADAKLALLGRYSASQVHSS